MLKKEFLSFSIDRRIFNFFYNCKLRECKISNEQNNLKIKRNDNYYFVKNNKIILLQYNIVYNNNET